MTVSIKAPSSINTDQYSILGFKIKSPIRQKLYYKIEHLLHNNGVTTTHNTLLGELFYPGKKKVKTISYDAVIRGSGAYARYPMQEAKISIYADEFHRDLINRRSVSIVSSQIDPVDSRGGYAINILSSAKISEGEKVELHLHADEADTYTLATSGLNLEPGEISINNFNSLSLQKGWNFYSFEVLEDEKTEGKEVINIQLINTRLSTQPLATASIKVLDTSQNPPDDLPQTTPDKVQVVEQTPEDDPSSLQVPSIITEEIQLTKEIQLTEEIANTIELGKKDPEKLVVSLSGSDSVTEGGSIYYRISVNPSDLIKELSWQIRGNSVDSSDFLSDTPLEGVIKTGLNSTQQLFFTTALDNTKEDDEVLEFIVKAKTITEEEEIVTKSTAIRNNDNDYVGPEFQLGEISPMGDGIEGDYFSMPSASYRFSSFDKNRDYFWRVFGEGVENSDFLYPNTLQGKYLYDDNGVNAGWVPQTYMTLQDGIDEGEGENVFVEIYSKHRDGSDEISEAVQSFFILDGNSKSAELSQIENNNESFAIQDGISKLKGTNKKDKLRVMRPEPSHLIGKGGNDRLTGGKFNDVLDGGSGNDVLKGRKGTDVYVLSEGKDKFLGINLNEGDTIEIDSSVGYALIAARKNTNIIHDGGTSLVKNLGPEDVASIIDIV